jgi:hypothetical protein
VSGTVLAARAGAAKSDARVQKERRERVGCMLFIVPCAGVNGNQEEMRKM